MSIENLPMYLSIQEEIMCIRGSIGKPAYTKKNVVKRKPRSNHSRRLSMNEKTINCNTKIGRNREKQTASQAHCAPNPKEKQGTSPAESLILLRIKTSYVLGCTTTDSQTQEINPFPICKRNKKSNTKGSRIIPYSGWLKQIPVELFPIPLMLEICSQQQQKIQACYIIWCQIYSIIYNKQCISN